MKDLRAELTFQQTENDNCSPSRKNLIKNDPFVATLFSKDTLHNTVGIALQISTHPGLKMLPRRYTFGN